MRASSAPGLDGRVGLPSRALSEGDQAAAWPDLYGGPGGTVALPSREASVATLPFADTAGSGIHADPRTTAEFPGAMAYDDYARLNATPHAVFALHYVRRFISTTAAALATMAVPRDATTSGTLNSSSDSGAPVSPIPAFRRFVVETLAEPFGWGRIYNQYLPPPEVQKPAAVRRMLAGAQLPRMGSPYLPALTRLALNPSATAPADRVLQAGNTSSSPAANPYASGSVPTWGVT